MKMYAFRDIKIGFMDPFLQLNDEIAIRTFRATIEDENARHLMRKYKNDIELWRVGEWNEEHGDITPDKAYLIGGKDI